MLELSEVINAYDQAIINSRAYGLEPNQLYISTAFHLKALKDILDKNVPIILDNQIYESLLDEYGRYVGECPICHRTVISNDSQKTCYCGQKLHWKPNVSNNL